MRDYDFQLLIRSNIDIKLKKPIELFSLDDVIVTLVLVQNETEQNKNMLLGESCVIQRIGIRFRARTSLREDEKTAYATEIRQIFCAHIAVVFNAKIEVISEVATQDILFPLQTYPELRSVELKKLNTLSLTNNWTIGSLRCYGVAQLLKNDPAAHFLFLFASMDALATENNGYSSAELQERFLSHELQYSASDASKLIKMRNRLAHGRRKDSKNIEKLILASGELNSKLVLYFQQKENIDNLRPNVPDVPMVKLVVGEDIKQITSDSEV